MKGFRSVVGLVGALIGVLTFFYIAWQFAIYGRVSARMASMLGSELAELKAPSAATLIRRNVSWEPGWARASEYYKSPLSHAAIEDYYAQQLAHQHWRLGPMPRTRPLTRVAIVYHMQDREFRLTFAAPESELTYEVTLLWVHPST